MNTLRKFLDPTLGAKARAFIRALGALGTLAALSANADVIAAAITAAQVLLAIFVAKPTTPPEV